MFKKRRKAINKAAFARMNANMYSKQQIEEDNKRKEKPFEIVLKFPTRSFIKRLMPELAEAKKIFDVQIIGRTTVHKIEIDSVAVGKIPLTVSLIEKEWEEIDKRVQKHYVPLS